MALRSSLKPSDTRRSLRVALTVILAGAPMLSAGPLMALFVSQYVEGSTNNKAVEIFNPTAEPLDLTGLQLRIYFNGSTTVGNTIALSPAVLPGGGTWVVTHDLADAPLLAAADQTSSFLTFNGNDAIELVSGATVIDSLGQVGNDPGAGGWVGGAVATANRTLRRLASVCAGDPLSGDLFDPSLEWDGYPVDSFAGLGEHSSTCSATVFSDGFESSDMASWSVAVPFGDSPD